MRRLFESLRFNSSLVRLGDNIQPSPRTHEFKVSIPAWCDWEHWGTIRAKEVNFVSIPAWCDWELRMFLTVDRETTMFQFQLGAIGSSRTQFTTFSTLSVSIPAWCDWEFQTLTFFLLYLYRFNSSLVRLGVLKSMYFTFKSFVSIPAWCDWEFLNSRIKSSLNVVSIPAWCDWETQC